MPPADGARVLVFGEQHDQLDQQRQVAEVVASEAAAGRLGAVVLEMADRGVTTAGLPTGADEAAVKQALDWREAGWPWAQYGPVVMAAVRAGVPVLGGNLPRAATRPTMADASLDHVVSAEVQRLLTRAIDEGHCGLLPASAMTGMLRVQVARDRSLAQVVQSALPSGRTVVLLTGAQHASADRGVPVHLVASGAVPRSAVRVVLFGGAGGLVSDERRVAEVTPSPDRCEALRQRMTPPAAPASAPG